MLCSLQRREPLVLDDVRGERVVLHTADEIPGKARLKRVKRVRACVEKLADAQGCALFEAIRAAYPNEAARVRECDEGMKKLGGG